MKKVLLFGSFDSIHPGHLFVIREAKKYGEVHAVAALDETIVRVKERAPFNSVETRMKNLESWGVKAHAGDAHDRLRVFKEVEPAAVILGYDQVLFVDQLKSYIEAQQLKTQVITAPPYKETIFKSKIIRRALEDPSAGFLLIDKLSGVSSMDSVRALRKITGIKQIGFAGTLDPLASGLLICGLASATSLLDWWHQFPKTYEAEALLGSSSDTYDITGVVTKISNTVPSQKEVDAMIRGLTGVHDQQPPAFSAKKIQGTRAYKLARTGVEVSLSKKHIDIYSAKVLEYVYRKLRFAVTCSSGTYVRSLVHDVGTHLNTGAVMSALRRTSIGFASVSDAVSVKSLTPENYRDSLLPIQKLQAELNRYYWSKD